jgi:hypothetical protein
VVGVLIILLVIPTLQAAESPKPEVAPREIFVPFNDLNVLLEQQPKRVLLSREEYNDLLKKAKKTPDEHAPQKGLIVSADYNAKLTPQRAEILGTLGIDVLEDGLHALPLDIAHVGLRSAKIDGRGASLGQSEGGPLTLFVEGKGRHELQLEMVAPIVSTAAKQQLQFRLPHPPAAKMQLTVPGDVEIKNGAAVISRTVDAGENAKQTRFELLPREGDVVLEMSLNSHLQRQSRAFAVRSVLIDEITEGYEKLHATVSLEILYQPMDQFRFAVPEGFEITEITSPLLARWDVQEVAGKKVVNVKLREQTTETVLLNLSALRTPSRLSAWQSPELTPLPLDGGTSDVIAQAAVVGLLIEDRLKPETIETDELIAIDTAVIGKALPASLAHPAPGTPPLKAVAAYYAPEGKFKLSAKFIKPPVEMAVSTSILWRVSDRGYEVLGGFTLLPRGEKLFSFDFTTPPEWTITAVTAAEEKPLKFDRFGPADKAGRVRVYVPQGMAADQEFKVNFHAVHTPKGWLAEWKSNENRFKDDFPVFAVSGAIRDEGAIAVEVRDDIVVRPENLKALIPLDDSEKAGYGLEGVTVNLAYRYENPQYAAAVVFERTTPRLSARTFSFLQISPEGLNAHYEVIFNIEEARTQNLMLLLPENTPTALSIRGLDGVVVKEFSADTPVEQISNLSTENKQPLPVDKMRPWRILLSEPKHGKVRLAVDFQQPLPSQEPKNYVLPLIAADGVIYQSGLVAVEGCAEYDLQVVTSDRKVDVGELVDADYQPGRRLLGVYGFAGMPPEVKINVARNPGYPIYPAIVQKTDLVTHLSPDGESHTEASFTLRTKALYLELQMPEDSELWSAEIDNSPIKPQRENKSILIGLPAVTGNTLHTLKVVYRTPTADLGFHGNLELAGPKLLLHADRKTTAEEVPLTDLEWKLCLPNGYEVVRSTGTVTTEELERPTPAAMVVAGSLYQLCGGVGHYGILPAVNKAAREVSSIASKRAVDSANSEYGRYEGTPATTEPASDEMTKSDVAPTELARDSLKQLLEPAAQESEQPAEEQQKVNATGGTTTLRHNKDKVSALRDLKKRAELAGTAESESINSIPKYPVADLVIPNSVSESAVTPSTLVPPRDQPAAQRGLSLSSKLTGVNSLKINLGNSPEFDGQIMVFKSLGKDPLLQIELADRQRFGMLGWAVALAAFLIGVALTRRPVRTKLGYVILLAIIATLVPAVLDSVAVAWVSNLLFYAACWLVLYYLVAGLLRCICRRVCCRAGNCVVQKPVVVATMLLVGLEISFFGTENLSAQDAAKPSGTPYVIQIVEPGPPVAVPDDAIIVPYDPALPPALSPEERETARKAEKLLLPYEKYVELWNRAYPDKKIETQKPPVNYALAGASYKTTLEGDEFLLVAGELEIDVYTNEFVQIPLGLNGGVLATATVDGKPARLSVAAVMQPAAQVPQQAAAPAPGSPDSRFFMLTLQGKGHHKLEIAVRLKITRDGGWRSVDGLLPAAPASACTITVPLSQTEVRMTRLSDRQSYDTEKPGETIFTALGPGGSLAVHWRPKAAETKVDLALTARSDAVLDVQEDGLRWTWQLNLDFRGKTLEDFTIDVPAMYVVEKVEGANVRGWQAEKKADSQTVKITLLKAAKDQEKIFLVLSKTAAIGQGSEKEFSVELVQLKQAALHTGRILIRRSPLLDLRTLDRAGMTRSDIPQELAKQIGAERVASPLNVQPFEAYTFDRNPSASLRFAADPVEAKMTTKVESILKITDANRTLDAKILFQVKDRPVYRLQMYLPDDFRLDHLLPGDFEYSITTKNDRRLLTIFSTTGRSGNFDIRLQGTLGKQTGLDKIALPRLEVLGVERQQGDIAVQASDTYVVDASDLSHCEKVLLDRFYGWLKPEQQSLTRLALQYRQGEYSGTLRLTPKKPEVTCDTLSNVRVTDRAIEETILLDFNIKNAGVRKFSFVLPWWMDKAKINVPLLREKSNEPLDKSEKSPRLVKIELQVEAMGLLRVLVENDRQLENTPQEVPIPKVNDVSVSRRYVTLESYGRDEIIVDPAKLSGLEKLLQGQKEWSHLKDLLGRAVTFAYLVAPDAGKPTLVYKSNERSAVQTAGARILLAETALLMDANGAYRAQQSLRLFNSTEQFLEIELPLGAELWTAQVAGESVKPVQDNPKDPRGVKIPLVKTAAGDLDYPVVFSYGGKMPAIGNIASLSFPLARCVNIKPELSQVNLFVPKDRQWFDFGGTMRQVEEADMAAEQVAVDTKRIDRLQRTLEEPSNRFEKIRAANNMKQLGLALHNYHDAGRSQSETNPLLAKELAANTAAIQTAQQDVAKFETAPQDAAAQDNRGKIRESFMNQTNGYVGKKLVQTGGNWDDASEMKSQGGEAGGKPSQQFNDAWLGQNKLLNPPASPAKADKAPQKGESLQLHGDLYDYSGKANRSPSNASQKPSSAQVAQGKFKQELSASNARQQFENPNGPLQIAGNEQSSKEQRYRQRLDQQQGGGQQSVQTWNFNGPAQPPAPGTNPVAANPAPTARPGGMPPGFGPPPAANAPGVGMIGGMPLAPPPPQAAPNPPATPPSDADSQKALEGQSRPVQAGVPALPSPTGLASLEVVLPTQDANRWSIYRFTTPRGEVEITARSLSDKLLHRVGYAAGTLAVILLIGFLVRLGFRSGESRHTKSSMTTLMIVLGLLALILGVLPVLGVLAIIAGLMLKITRAGAKESPAI